LEGLVMRMSLSNLSPPNPYEILWR
jgi:hypothetical protein